MEAFSVYKDETKRHRRRLDAFSQQPGEVKRNVVLPLAPSLDRHLESAQDETDHLFKEFETRLLWALEVLSSTAELIHPMPEILAASRANFWIKDPADNLILASILDHSKNYPLETKIFLSENRKDFDINSEARLALQAGGFLYFADASKCLDWHRSQPGS